MDSVPSAPAASAEACRPSAPIRPDLLLLVCPCPARRQAIAADPRNPLAKFERATVLMAEDRWRDALAELHVLRVRRPRKAGVLGMARRAGRQHHLGSARAASRQVRPGSQGRNTCLCPWKGSTHLGDIVAPECLGHPPGGQRACCACLAGIVTSALPASPPTPTLRPPGPPSQDVAPREASVLFHMGKIYKRLDMLDEAMACFASALDLQPPSADTNLIKSAGRRPGPARPALPWRQAQRPTPAVVCTAWAAHSLHSEPGHLPHAPACDVV